jgi:hypothetical protein
VNGDDDRYHGVLRALGDVVREWQEFKAQLSGEIAEYKKTVNTAIAILGQESFASQADTKQRLEADAQQRAQRQTRSDRKDIAVLAGVGCLIVLNAAAITALVIVLIVLNWR